ncbi:MAG: ABC transporter permease [Nitrososphaerales archaeon]
MSLYWHVAVKSFQKNLAYRAANLAGIATNLFFGAVYVLVYRALFTGRGEVSGFTVDDTVTYAVLAQSLLMVMSAFGNRELSDAIVKGTIAVDLARPIDFYRYWAAVDLGRAVYYFFFRAIPTFLLGALLFGVEWPADLRTWVLFFAAMVLGMLVSFAFRFLTNSFAFWTSDARGVLYLTNTIIMFFSGFIVPLNFFPSWLASLAYALPFRGLAQAPINVYLGKMTAGDIFVFSVQQMLWLVALTLAGRFMLTRMVRRVTLAGG